jgi:hypothetical protein
MVWGYMVALLHIYIHTSSHTDRFLGVIINCGLWAQQVKRGVERST